MPETDKFRVNDRVEVLEGWHKGKKGRMVTINHDFHYPYTPDIKRPYGVKFRKYTVHFTADQLAKVSH